MTSDVNFSQPAFCLCIVGSENFSPPAPEVSGVSWQQPPDMGDWAANKDLVVDGKVRAALAAGTIGQWHSGS